jgi:hypothetical protein
MHFNVLAGIKPPLDLSTKILGQDASLPFFGCPTAGNRMFHCGKERRRRPKPLSITELCTVKAFVDRINEVRRSEMHVIATR